MQKKLRTTFLQYEKKRLIDKTVNFILSLANVPALIKIGLHKKKVENENPNRLQHHHLYSESYK